LKKDYSRLINRYFSQMKSSDAWTPIAKLDEITKGKLLLWEEDGYSLLLTQIADRIICFENVCPHLGWPLEMSAVNKDQLICPHHGFEFDLLSGTCPFAPELSLHHFPVRIRDQYIEVRLNRVGPNGPN
jgi:nitrite reductase/ring-hydroxylating ferredoxin subunit